MLKPQLVDKNTPLDVVLNYNKYNFTIECASGDIVNVEPINSYDLVTRIENQKVFYQEKSYRIARSMLDLFDESLTSEMRQESKRFHVWRGLKVEVVENE